MYIKNDLSLCFSVSEFFFFSEAGIARDVFFFDLAIERKENNIFIIFFTSLKGRYWIHENFRNDFCLFCKYACTKYPGKGYREGQDKYQGIGKGKVQSRPGQVKDKVNCKSKVKGKGKVNGKVK